MQHLTLNHSIQKPIAGFGVFQIPEAVDGERCVVDAIEVGHRLIDIQGSYAHRAGKRRAIEVSNLHPDPLMDLKAFNGMPPAVNQVAERKLGI